MNIHLTQQNLTIFLVSAVSIILVGAISLTVYFHNRRSRVNQLFSLYLFLLIGWLAPAAVYISFGISVAELILFQMMPGSLLGTMFYFFSRAIYRSDYSIRPVEYLLFMPPAIIIGHNIFILMDPALLERYRATVAVTNFALTRKPDALYALYSANLIATFLAGLVIIGLSCVKEKDPPARKRNIWIFSVLVLTVPALLVTVNIMTLLGSSTKGESVSLILTASIILIGFSIVRQRAWTIEYLLDVIRDREAKLAQANLELTAANGKLLAAQEVAQRDLNMAVNVQRTFLPSEAPVSDEWELSYFLHPMAGVSSDFYDFYVLDGRLAGVGIFDVSGHGIASALVTMIAKSIIFRNFKKRTGPGLGGVFDRSNHELYHEIGMSGFYLTGILLRLSGGRVEYANANHPQLLLKRGASADRIVNNSGFFIGMFPDHREYETVSFDCSPGDCIVLYSDGVIEAADESGAILGDERLRSILAGAPAGSASAVLDHLVAGLADFTGGLNLLRDDATVIVLKKL
ncbi:MAG TPA: PP2C family protein-serine/threonine phosphatase [Spirochaetota bacterium]|nr:PP2C family protein-serine/threonine phosphatase [Spirochaetota bacterium]HPC41129.1 PP2C family protein-serine/threonine phosphatase [Spirochaetota bacterium]HQF07049.1 PP2C family protein-serine/threonine phosphatase [Spirochaetota bacterium]HQJ71666.1 PP2C family protein-serine/threonine phosphatase [Spirochaetota bacterium]HRS78204.1 PP2C family protein-serine/threonine phosphatase [Spirochaetota bacterium]